MIHISLLGDFQVVGAAGRKAVLQTRRGTELLAFLVLEAGRTFDRGRLAEQFWGHLPEARARRALNTELWRMTQALREIGMDTDASFPRHVSGVSYQSGPECAIDVDVIRAAMAVVRATDPAQAGPEELAKLEAGVAAYRGDLLETVYSDWCLLWRENLRAQYFEALDFLREAAMARQDWAAGLRYGRTLLTLDPLQEHVHRAVMRCHFHNGDRPLAMRQYAICEQVLREELGVAPMDETRRIQQTILAVPGKPVVSVEPAPRRRSDALRSPVQKVDMALSNLNTARSWLEEASADMRGEG